MTLRAIGVAICLVLLLTAEGRGQETQSPVPAVLTAEQVIFDTEANTATARGNVVLSREDRRLLADEIVYDQESDRVFAHGHIVLIEPSGETFFADQLEVTGDLRDATIEGVKALLDEQTRVAAARGTREEGAVNTLERAVYTPCPVCREQGPLWQIKADRVVWDQRTQTVTYRNARLEFLGVPVAFTPFFSHPDPTVKRKTGFLTPTFGTSSTLGFTAETPYFIALAPNRDLTILPLFASDVAPVLGLEFRDLQDFGRTELDGSITYTDRADEGDRNRDGQTVRGHIRGTGRYDVAEHLVSGFDLFVTTDETYLDRYDISDDDVLENEIFLNRVTGGDFLGLSAHAFQTLREDDEQDEFPFVLPLAEARLRSSPMRWGSQLTYDASLVALTRIDGIDDQRITNEVGWEVPWLGPVGDQLRFRMSLRGDFYSYRGDPETLGGGDGSGTEFRGIPRATLDWSWPLVGQLRTFQYYIEPTAMLTLAPYGLNRNSIPNEDSIEFEFDETNLFEPDRFTGFDLVDEGPRLAYGLRFGSLGGRVLDVSGVVGQSWQPREQDEFPAESGVRDKLSDIVGRLDFRPSDLLNIRYRFRVDHESLELRRNDIRLSIGPPRLRVDLGYIRLSREPEDLVTRSREEILVGLRVQPIDSLAVAAQMRRDLSRDAQVSNLFGLVYTHPCLQLVAGLEQKFTERGELDDEITFKVRVTLATLGSFSGGL